MAEGQTNCNSCGAPLTAEELAGPGYGSRSVLVCAACTRIWQRQVALTCPYAPAAPFPSWPREGGHERRAHLPARSADSR
jgi:hypothetical protein